MQQHKDYIGKFVVTDKTLYRDSNDILDTELPTGTRVIKPDTIVSMDFVENRLNVHLDKDHKIIKQTIG